MFNQVILIGKVGEIYEDHIDLRVKLDPVDKDKEMIIPVQMSEILIAHLLLDNVCGIKGRVIIENGVIGILCDKLTILDARGKSNEGN